MFIVSNVHAKDDSFISALRSWAGDCSLYTTGSLIVYFTESPEEVIGQGTISMCIVVDVAISTPGERKKVIDRALEDIGAPVEGETNGKLVAATRGLTLHQTESLVLESIFRYGKVRLDYVSRMKAEMVKKSGTAVVKEPHHGFEAVGGYNALKDYVHYSIIKPLTTGRERAKRLGLRPPRGMLMYGPPGTGKSWFALSLAKELRMPFLELKPDMRSKWVGESERNFENFRKVAEASAPAVVFLDEVDEYGRRQEGQHETDRRIHNALLKWLGDPDRKCIVVAATNLPRQLGPALTRDGRFDVRVPVLYPDSRAREEIFRVHTSEVQKLPLAKDVDLKKLSELTRFFSGAEIEGVVNAAVKLAYRNHDEDVIKQSDLEQAVQARNISPEERRQEMEDYIAYAEKGSCTDPQFIAALKEEMVRDKSGATIEAGRGESLQKALRMKKGKPKKE